MDSDKEQARIHLRRPKGGGPGNPRHARIWETIGFALGALIILTGLAASSAGGDSQLVSITTVYPQVSASAVLQGAREGQLFGVVIPQNGAATVRTSKAATSGALAQESQSPVEAGQYFNFFLNAALTEEFVKELLRYNVSVWMDSGQVAVAGVPYGMPLSAFTTTGGAGAAARQNSAGVAAVAKKEQASPLEAENSATPVYEDSWLRTWGRLLTITGFLVFGYSLFHRMRRRGDEKRAQAKAQAQEEKNTNDGSVYVTTRFTDVAGADEAVESLREMVDFIKNSDKYRSLGAKLPKGALLVGPPGTGKTLIARAVAGEAGVPFFSAAGSDFVEKYVGVGAQRVRALFKQAHESGKAIVFIDEVDAIARKRSSDGSAGNAEGENTLIALLNEMDGFKGSDVIVLAATNRPDILDPALTRPGRLDRRVEVPLPDRRGREKILAVHARGVKTDPDVDLELFARRTPGFSGAQLEAVVNEAALEAVRIGHTTVKSVDFDQAIATVAMGRARTSALVTDTDRLITAWHEAGHTLCALLLADADEPTAVSIIPRGPAGGVTWMAGGDDQFLSRAKAHARLVVALGGRAAEQLLLGGEFTQGASGDLQSATETALMMTTMYGMTRLGLANRGGQHLGGTSSKEVTDVVEELLAGAHEEATMLIAEHRDLLEAIADALLEYEDLDARDLARIAEQCDITPASRATRVPAVPDHGTWTPPHDAPVEREEGAWANEQASEASVESAPQTLRVRVVESWPAWRNSKQADRQA